MESLMGKLSGSREIIKFTRKNKQQTSKMCRSYKHDNPIQNFGESAIGIIHINGKGKQNILLSININKLFPNNVTFKLVASTI